MGMSGEFVRHLPLSLLYVASGLIKDGFEVTILDNRVAKRPWKEILLENIGDDTLFAGITVMSGSPIANAIEISKSIKSIKDIPVVWGGAHPTIMPRQILEEAFIDFTVSGSGVGSARQLAAVLSESGQGTCDFKDIPGLGYKEGGAIKTNPIYGDFEHVPYRELPYSLIKDFSPYGQMGSEEKIFPLFSSYGCVYNCAFCVSPHLYRSHPTKWLTIPVAEVVEHIKYLKSEYGATEIYFYDDDSFINLNHVHSIIEEVKKQKMKIRMSFRGARVNEVLKMDDAYLNDLAEAGTHILHIGIESGSQRILDLFKKGITVEDIVKMNRRLARNRQIIAAYNWIVGTPTETMNDIAKTRNLILQLVRDNPRCFIFPPNKFRPLPGTELAKLAVRYGYAEPPHLKDWISEELESDKAQPWYTGGLEGIIRMLQVTSYFIDNKASLILEKKSLGNNLIKFFSRVYEPLARYRFEHGVSFGLVEYPLYQFFVSRYQR